ncbi:MAG: hypothetical protein IJA20_01880 [Methanocorpusculum sp.]|nr:hypothetical protein [Oscillospiraceae bacterium]MBQ3569401.1 hypothetical protein [Methanocorpusculum sp.]
MTEARKHLTERELEILELREQKVSYRIIAEKYGVSQSRAQSIYKQAKRRLREEQRRILTRKANQMIVPTGFSRSQLIIIRDALYTLRLTISNSVTHTWRNLTELEEKDPVYQKAGQVLVMVEKLLEKTSGQVTNMVEENTKETVPEMLALIQDVRQKKGGGEE